MTPTGRHVNPEMEGTTMSRTTRITIHPLPAGTWHDACGACLIGDPSVRVRPTAWALRVTAGAMWETALCTVHADRWARRAGTRDERPGAGRPERLELETPTGPRVTPTGPHVNPE